MDLFLSSNPGLGSFFIGTTMAIFYKTLPYGKGTLSLSQLLAVAVGGCAYTPCHHSIELELPSYLIGQF